MKEIPLEERFWNYVEKTENCWIWIGAIHRQTGYGAMTYKRKVWTAHRLSYFIAHGEIPPKMHVLHHCDNRKCVNPDHLFIGTNTDNVHDAISKGRLKGVIISDETVEKVRRLNREFVYRMSFAEIGRICGINQNQASRIAREIRRAV